MKSSALDASERQVLGLSLHRDANVRSSMIPQSQPVDVSRVLGYGRRGDGFCDERPCPFRFPRFHRTVVT